MQVPDGWQVVRLGDILVLNQPGAWGDEPSPDDPGVRVLRATDLTRDGRVNPEAAAWRRLSDRDRERRLMRDGDLILERSGGGPGTPVGRVAIIDGFGPVYCTNFCQHLRVDASRCSPFYVARALWHRYVQGVTTRLQHQTTGIRNLDYAGYLAFPLLLPPLPEQRAIAAVLDSIDEAIEGVEAVITATERLRDALLHELLTRGVPGWHTQWKDVPGIGTIPAAWDVVRLGDVVTIASGQSDPKAAKFQDSLFVAPDDIESGTGRLINRRTVAEAHAISGKYRFDKFEVLYSKIRPYLMKVYRPHESGLCSADIYPLRPKSMLEAAYLALVLLSLSLTDYTRTCSDRTGIPKINRIDLFKYRLTLPSLPEQRTITAVLGGVDGAITRAREEYDMFRSLKEATADALLTGRVRISREGIYV